MKTLYYTKLAVVDLSLRFLVSNDKEGKDVIDVFRVRWSLDVTRQTEEAVFNRFKSMVEASMGYAPELINLVETDLFVPTSNDTPIT